MLDYARLAPGEAFDRVEVEVVFLRMDQAPRRPRAVFPAGAVLSCEPLGVAEYRMLYNEVGAPWLWWLRRMMPDDMLARHLANAAVAFHVLRVDGQVAGFFETDAGYWPNVNLNYFGLMPGFIGKGLGKPLLDAAVDSVFAGGSPLRGMTVNTCSADHPRALPNYVAAGFKEVRRIREEWDIPRRLGLKLPEHLRG
ncbi:N-acetyltransferase [Acidocella aquatica]|uniref:N-acetyltransferase n=1 Tax=Acidocella aquatica TaxID=1922313 RepID=A0ABQ6A595_9PROT|nr:GNAT family N-acetyltransferase [Acidocella aquatica]GLR67339.1 N-acetyltransferase [Acidocella aquatica]